MPDYTVKADVDAMLRADNDAAIRSAIGVGQTDAPTFLAQTLTSQGLANAPSLAIGTGAGFYQPTNTQISFSSNGSEAIRFAGAGIRLGLNELGFGSAFNVLSDTILVRDGAAGILAQRNGTNAQAFRVYNTYTDASNYERGVVDWKTSTNVLRIATEASGTGSLRGVNIDIGASISYTFRTNLLTMPGGLSFVTDNAHDIGASGANRPRNIFVAQTVRANAFQLNSTSHIFGTVDGIIGLYNNALTDFNRLQLGGTTSAFPAIKRNGTGIDIRLADDSAFAPLSAGSITANASIVAGGTLSVGNSSVVLKDAGSLVLQFLNSGQTAGVVLDATTDGVAKFRLRGNAAFATLQGKLTTDTAYTGTVVAATGYITIYDSTGQAYRVPCTV